MNPNILLVGSSTPLQKVLYSCDTVPGVTIAGLYVPIGQSREIESSAASLRIPLFDIKRLREDQEIEKLRHLNLSWIFSINSTIIFSPNLLSLPRIGCLNLHPGKLPEYAGLHTHQWAIRNGEVSFGATIHWMAPAVDTGDIAYSEQFPISPTDTGLSLYLKCMDAGTRLAIHALREIGDGTAVPRIQQDLSKRVLYRAQDALSGEIDWNQSAQKIFDLVRAADYGPFSCPTYTPTTWFKQKSLLVKKGTIEKGTPGRGGEVLATTNTGLLVSAGDNNGIVISSGFTGEKKLLSGAGIAKWLEIKPGDYLGKGGDR